MKKLLLLCLPFATTMVLAQQTDPSAKYAALITPQALKQKLSILAAADMEGRETASPGQKKAAAWIESQFKNSDYCPATEIVTSNYTRFILMYSATSYSA